MYLYVTQQQNVYDIIITRAGSDCERRLASHVIRFYLHLRLTSAAATSAAVVSPTHTHTHSHMHKHPQCTPLSFLIYNVRQRETKESTRMRASAHKRSKAEQTWGAEQQWESGQPNQWAVDSEREREKAEVPVLLLLLLLLAERGRTFDLHFDFQHRAEQQLSTILTHSPTHTCRPPHCIFWRTWRASKYLPNVCWVYCPRFTFANLRTRRKEEERDKERSELTVTKARPQWKCFLFSTHRGNLYIFVYVSVSLRVFVFVPTSRVHVQLPIGLAGVVSVCLCICLSHPLSLWVMCTWAIAMQWRYICREYTLSVHRHVLISSNCYKYTTHY